MDCLIDNLNPDQWKEVSACERGDGFVEFSLNRNHKHKDPTTVTVLIASEDGNPKTVDIPGCLANKDPIKSVARAELKLNEDGTKILGIDVEGDCVLLKS